MFINNYVKAETYPDDPKYSESYKCDTDSRYIGHSNYITAIVEYNKWMDRYKVIIEGKVYEFGEADANGIYKDIFNTSSSKKFQLKVEAGVRKAGFMSSPDGYTFKNCKKARLVPIEPQNMQAID